MAGILGSHTDASCNTHNALRNISEYACGVSFQFKQDGFDGFQDGYAVVSLQECCAEVNATLMRIPGNTGCEIQFCEVSAVPSSYTETITYASATGTGAGTGTATAVQTPAPTVSQGVSWGPPPSVENCMASVYSGDLPGDVAQGVAWAGNWCVVRNYDDESDEQGVAVTAAAAPAAWTTAATSHADNYLTMISTSVGSAATGTSSQSGGVRAIAGPRKRWGTIPAGLLLSVLVALV